MVVTTWMREPLVLLRRRRERRVERVSSVREHRDLHPDLLLEIRDEIAEGEAPPLTHAQLAPLCPDRTVGQAHLLGRIWLGARKERKRKVDERVREDFAAAILTAARKSDELDT